MRQTVSPHGFDFVGVEAGIGGEDREALSKSKSKSSRFGGLHDRRVCLYDWRVVPTIFVQNGFRFFFFSNEGSPLEPPHVHVRKAEKLAKIWLDPAVSVAQNYGFTGKELNQLLDMVHLEEELIREHWNQHFGL